MKEDNPFKKSGGDSSLDKLERDLYNPQKKHEQRSRRRLHGANPELERDFKGDKYDNLIQARSKYALPTSLFKKVFFAALIFFTVTLLIAGVTLYEKKKNVSEDLILMEVLGQPFVDGGEEMKLKVRIQNQNDQELQDPDLILSYPKDSTVDAGIVTSRKSLPNVPKGKEFIEEFDVTLFGQEGNTRTFNAILEYRIKGSSSIFVKKISYNVIIRSTPTDVSIKAPEIIVRNQEVTFVVDVSSNTNVPINNTVLKINYPRGFEFIRSSRVADFSNNIWYLQNLTKEPKRIEVVGRLAGLEGQGQSFNVVFGKQSNLNKNEIETIFNALTHTIDIQKSFIDASVRVNNSKGAESSVRGGGDLSVVVKYENTLDTPLQNVQLRVKLDGDLYNPSKLNLQDGFYNSSIGTIIFDQTTSNRLKVLEPGQKGEFRFTVYTRDLVSSEGVLTNPFVDFTVDVTGTGQNGKLEQASSVARHRVKANSDLSVIPKVQYYQGSFQNSGPMPPRVNVPTTYTIVFQVVNSSNEIGEAELSTTLPPYVNWLNTIAPSVERSNILFDQTTRKLTWKLGTVKAGVGTGSNQPRQLSVQLQVIPSAIQVGEAINLTNEINLSGKDVFTDTKLNYKKTPIASRLDDRSQSGADGRVVN